MQKFKLWIKDYGGPAKVARRLDINRQTVHRWLSHLNSPAPKQLIALVRLSKGYLSCDDITYETQNVKPYRRKK